MANILYGVNGEGSGHSTRAKEIITHLEQRGHRVAVVSFDRGLANLRRDFEVTEIHGWRLEYLNNQVRYGRTIAKNVLGARRTATAMSRLKQLVDDLHIELVITDFEPLSCHVAHRKHLPVISIDNQHFLTNTDVTYPSQCRRDAAAAKVVIKFMVPRADAYLTTSFFPATVTKPSTFLFPPILRQSVLQAHPTDGEHVLVYVTSPAPRLARMLAGVKREFIAYGFNREGQRGNILYKKPTDGFLSDLTTADAIIANAGFSLVTEALHLGKPYLAVPVKHQFEQIFNAYWLKKLCYGDYWEDLNSERIESFLSNLTQYRERLRSYPRQGNDALLSKLDGLIAGETHPL
jgi:uncharacterized protein (TIGR00661 family)